MIHSSTCIPCLAIGELATYVHDEPSYNCWFCGCFTTLVIE